MDEKEIEHLKKYQLNPTKNNSAFKWFMDLYKFNSSQVSLDVLEIGTLRWSAIPTHWRDRLSGWNSYVRTDITDGEDVDVTSDVHKLTGTFGSETKHVIICRSVFEHLERPWDAAKEILNVLRPGGFFYIQTHFAFVEHGYPNDYFRFTRAGLESLFKEIRFIESSYDYPCIITEETQNNQAFLNVAVTGIK